MGMCIWVACRDMCIAQVRNEIGFFALYIHFVLAFPGFLVCAACLLPLPAFVS
jgi:hypothetical protein